MSTRINAASTPLHVHARNYRKLIQQLIAQGLVTSSQNGVKLTTPLAIRIDCKVPLEHDGKPVLAWWTDSRFGGTSKRAPFLETPFVKPLPLEEQDSMSPK